MPNKKSRGCPKKVFCALLSGNFELLHGLPGLFAGHGEDPCEKFCLIVAFCGELKLLAPLRHWLEELGGSVAEASKPNLQVLLTNSEYAFSP